MNDIFAVTSGKGGVGKSTVSVSLAAAFEKMGRKVLIIDMDEGLRCLDLMLGVSESVVFDLSDILNGESVSSALYPVPGHKGICLIPAPVRFENSLDGRKLAALVNFLSEKFDEVILDFPAGLDFRLYEFLPDYTVFLTVANPDPVSVRDAEFVGKELSRMEKRKVRLIINKFLSDYVKKGIYSNIDDIIDTSEIQLIGIVPYDKKLPIYSSRSEILCKGKTFKAFTRIAKRLDSQNVPLPKVKKI